MDAFPNLTLPDTLVIEPNPSDDRLYVGSREGVIVSFQNDEQVSTAEPFMDLTDRVAVVNDGGFLGLTFHPDFGTPGSPNETTFYAYYSTYCPTTFDGQTYVVDFNNCNPGYPQGVTSGFFNTWLRLSRFHATFDAQAGVWRGDPASEEPLFNIRLYNSSHRGGGPVFANDGYLYVAVGDQFRYVTAQDITDNFEGGTMRLAVDVVDNGDGTWTCPAGSHQPIRRMQDVTGNPDEVTGNSYCIPNDNPWPGLSGQNFGEYNSLGHRNPHRIALDPVTGLLWSGEVGEDTREEINVILTGRNYQWPYMEGLVPGASPKPATIIGIEQPPVIDFVRAEAQTIIGGYVYRGTRFPELSGYYIAGDYSTDNIWAIALDVNTMTATKQLLTTFPSGSLGTFGQDRNGEIFMGDVAANIPLQRLERLSVQIPDPPALLSQTGAFTDTANFVVSPAGVPYDPVPFWSDNAFKQRWLFLPNDGTHDTPEEQIAFSEQGNWDFPVGTVAMKQFDLPIDEANPDLRVRLETRFMVKGDDGQVYGVTYRWRPDQSDADLLEVAEAGDYTIQLEGGGTRQQTWLFPSRAECLQCHTDGAGGYLGLRTHQENHDFTYPSTGRTDNQLRTWNALGMFTPPLVEADIPTFLAGAKLDDVTASLELRARSWLDSNCSNCHRPETGNRAVFDARLTTPLLDQGLVWGGLIDDLGIPDAYVVHPGNPLASVLYQRAAAFGGSGIKMPPLAKQLAQEDALGLLSEWILRLDPGYPRVGLSYEYYELSGLSALPDFDAVSPVATGTAPTFDISLRLRDDNFAFRFTGYIEIPQAGDWTFYTTSDEGSQLFIDGALVVDNDGLHLSQEGSGTVNLSAGFHSIVVTMFERDAQQELSVSLQGPGVTKQLVPLQSLFLEVPGPLTNNPPVLADPGPQTSSVGEAVLLPLSASDPDGNLLHFEAAGLPSGLSVDSQTGQISGIVALDAAGTTTVTASVSDGPDVSVVGFDWTIDGTPDTTDPSVTLTAPAAGSVGGVVTLQAAASDDRGVVGVQFLVDGAPLGPEDTTAPYEAAWDTWPVANGSYTLSAEARDAAGNTGQAAGVAVTVDNTPDATAPTVSLTAPAAGTVSGQVTLQADATDDVGVVGVQFLLDGAPLGPEDLAAPYAFVWDTSAIASGSYLLSAEARDAAGNTAQAADVAVSVDNTSPPPVAAWDFEEGAGTLAADATGHGHDGTVSGASWTAAGRFGNALEFNGVDDVVLVPNAPGLDLGSAMTLSAWVYPTQAPSGWAAIVQKQPDAYLLHAGSDPGPGAAGGGTDGGGCCSLVTAASTPPANAWTHLAVTYDGAQWVLYVDGVAVDSTAASGPLLATTGALRIGNNSYAEGFAGRIDDLRIYARALSAAEIQADMNTPVTPLTPDTTDPMVALTAPVTASVAGVVSLQATASDDRGVVGVQFLLDGAPLGPEDGTAPYEFLWDTSSVANGPYTLSAEARDAAGNTGQAAGVAVTVDNVPDATPPTVSLTAPAPGTVSGQVTLQADATDDVGVVGVQFLMDGAPLGPEDLAAPYEFVWDTSAIVSSSYLLSAQARDAGGNTAQAAGVAVTVDNTSPPPVAAWSFDEGAGTQAADATGNGHNGVVSGATWTTAGRFGNALEFNGVDDVVLVSDAPELDLGAAMTLSAWVYPTQPPSGWTAVVQKDTDAYFLHAASSPGPGAAAGVTADAGCCSLVTAPSTPPANAWTHLAVTYDGAQLVYYMDGTQVASAPASGPIQASTGTLRIGNNSYAEGFTGRIDEVRVYDRALSAAELAADMATPVEPPDTTPPSAPGAPTATPMSASRIDLGWGAATDDVGVTGYLLERCEGSGCSSYAEIATPTGTSFSDTGLATLTHYEYRVRATDAAGNLGPYSAVVGATTTAPDTQPPTAPGTLAATAISGTWIHLSWGAATDDVAVAEYQVERCQGSACTSFSFIASAGGTTYDDTGLSVNTLYRYRVRAADATGNTGPYSNIAQATTSTTPSGFVNEVVVQNLDFVPTMRFLPDGKLLMGEITGTLRIVQPGGIEPDPTPFNVITDAVQSGDAGLLDLTLDPDFANNNYYYVYYAHGTSTSYRDRVSRFTATPSWDGTVPGSEVVVWEDDAATTTDAHHGATIDFGPDGKLYISIGDNGIPPDSQSLTSYHGKLLRINADGSAPADNPFVDGPGGNKDEIWAYGLRNPFRFSFDSATGNVYIGDVGGNDPSTAFEEVNLGSAGANFGWPTCEGICGIAGITDPIYTYAHQGRDAAVTGGFVYRGSALPAEYQGNYFFADYAQNWLKRLTLDPSGTQVTGVFPFQPIDGSADNPQVGDPVQVLEGPDGQIYYLDLSFDETNVTFNEGTLRRVRFLGSGNQPPVVVATANPQQGDPPLQVSFSSAGTVDPEGDPLSYDWDFGDGATSSEANPVHTYSSRGQYDVTLTVSDGASSPFQSLSIVVGNPPTGVILSPVDASLFQALDQIQITGDGSDVEDGTLPDSAFSWTIVFHHEGHVHPVIGPVVGVRNLTFDIPDSGHDFEGFTRYEVILTVTDSDGLKSVSSVFIFPDKVNLSFDTLPSGLDVDLDGVSRATPFVVGSLKGFQHTLNAPDQIVGGSSYTFTGWSDAGARSHGIVTPDLDTAYVASFDSSPLPLDPALVAAYGFEEGTGTLAADATGRGHDGAVSGAIWAPGRLGQGLQFNGVDDVVLVPSAPDLDLGTAMTLSAWVYPMQPLSGWAAIVQKETDAYLLHAASNPGPGAAAGVTADAGCCSLVTAPSIPPDYTWTHLAVTYDGTQLVYYMNGTQVASAPATGPIQATTGALRLGNNTYPGEGFGGRIDEVRIYDRALSPAEIQADMVIPLPEPGEFVQLVAGIGTLALLSRWRGRSRGRS